MRACMDMERYGHGRRGRRARVLVEQPRGADPTGEGELEHREHGAGARPGPPHVARGSLARPFKGVIGILCRP